MGNTIKTLALCDCFFPKQYEEELYLKGNNQNSRFRTINKMPSKSCDIFTITSPEPAFDFFLSSTRTSLNDIRLSSDLLSSNLIKMSNDLNSSICSVDSGFDRTNLSSTFVLPEQSNNFEILAINLETISQYSFKSQNSIFTRNVPGFDLLYTSLFNFPYLLNKSFNKLLTKNGLKQAIFSSTFVITMKEKINIKTTKKIRTPITNKNDAENNTTALFSTVTDQNRIQSSPTEGISIVQRGFSHLFTSFNSLYSLHKFASTIYDVNYF